MLRKVTGARPAMWWISRESASSAFLSPGLPGAGEACPYSLAPGSELGRGPCRGKEYLARRGPEDLSEPQEGGAGSMGRELVADVGGGTSGELGLRRGTTEPSPPFLRWSQAVPAPASMFSEPREGFFSKLASVYPVTYSLSLPFQLPLTSALPNHLLTPSPDLTS